jgi:hypothetical protein
MMTSHYSKGKLFTVGGAVPTEEAYIYVYRPADKQLFDAVLSGEYCNILTPRQMGKSSLMVRTAEHLQQKGVRTTVIDLTDIGTELDAEEWYFGLIACLKQELGLAVDERAWWDEHSQKAVSQRFLDFLRYVVLKEIAAPVVIFVNEIDATLSLPFTDGFFAALRVAYNTRTSDPVYKRLTFVLLGGVRQVDLVKDRFRLPYDIGLSIDLHDFTPEETKDLLPGLEAIPADETEVILERVLYWTGGHPYLTQKICAEIAAAGDGPWPAKRIGKLVERSFLSGRARREESNLQFVRNYIRESRNREQMLRIYKQVREGDKPVADDKRDPVKSQLKLAGLLKVTPQSTLTVRNRIYKEVFNPQWIGETLPKVGRPQMATVTTVGTAFALTVLIASLLSAFIIKNGSFETPELSGWDIEGTLPVVRGEIATEGLYSAQLGAEVTPGPQSAGRGVLYQAIEVMNPKDKTQPVLIFSYKMVANDIMSFSHFHVWLEEENSKNKYEIKRDGFNSCDREEPAAGHDFSWRTVRHNLSGFEGKKGWLKFEVRNIWPNAKGIWAYVDNVRIENFHLVYLPVTYRADSVSAEGCDDICANDCDDDCSCGDKPYCCPCICERDPDDDKVASCYPCVTPTPKPSSGVSSLSLPRPPTPTPTPSP